MSDRSDMRLQGVRGGAQPLVSVRVVTYNHEPYIAQCLEGILSQRTDFPFEVIVGEDCSTDRTRETVLAYAAQYPDSIRAIVSETNVGAAQNAQRVLQACRGRYHAFCEGDDYWVDPLKLQKQVAFMEAHPEVPLCFHNLFVLNERAAAVRLWFPEAPPSIVSFEDACRLKVHLASVLARSEVLASLPDWRFKIWCGDLVVRLWCAHAGPLGYIDQIMGVHRRHPGGITLAMGPLREKRYADEMDAYRLFDRDTQLVHTASIRAELRKIADRRMRERLGPLYFVVRPDRLVAKVREYHSLVRRQLAMYR